MDQSEALKADPTAAAPRVVILGQRRNFLVSRRYQLKTSMIAGSVVLALLVFINVMLYQASVRGSAQILADAPELSQIVRSQDRAQALLIGLASLVFLGGVIVVGILETHRTAGAAFNISRQLGEVTKGRYSARVRLRKGDNLQELEEEFNNMTGALSRRVIEQVDRLHQLADDAEQGADGARVAAGLRELAARNSAMVAPPG